jgi:lipopolysaccharide transport system permease protein
MTLLIALVFGRIFHVEIGTYAPYILSGIVVWDFFVGTCVNGSLAFVQADAYIKQCRHPLAIYTLRASLSNLIVMACACVALVAWVLVAMPGNFGWSWIAALSVFPIVGLLGWALATSLAYVSVRFRDVPFALNLLLQAVWFVSPVYFEAKVFRDSNLRALIDYNPIYHLLQLVRAPLLDGQWPTPANFGFSLGSLAVAALVAWLIGSRAESRVIFYL